MSKQDGATADQVTVGDATVGGSGQERPLVRWSRHGNEVLLEKRAFRGQGVHVQDHQRDRVAPDGHGLTGVWEGNPATARAGVGTRTA